MTVRESHLRTRACHQRGAVVTTCCATRGSGTVIGVVGVDVNLGYIEHLAQELTEHAQEGTATPNMYTFVIADLDKALIASTFPSDIGVLAEEEAATAQQPLLKMSDPGAWGRVATACAQALLVTAPSLQPLAPRHAPRSPAFLPSARPAATARRTLMV